ncbi:hypothetical protein RISK_000468 [Rhodopirellula islandica]|uniref:Uncharacterized protein n=1 Tax=Rhodopirellula islandica TaxID=595434 RepID=A0A0J1BLL8_RHOIS|nr:hypothetical protein RISK_000468 [Rhodopirellula islandica]
MIAMSVARPVLIEVVILVSAPLAAVPDATDHATDVFF